MESTVRKVKEIATAERQVYETVLGEKLRENQQVILQVTTVSQAPEAPGNGPDAQQAGQLPDWCNVYDGLSEQEIAEVERVCLSRSDMSRSSS
jgi:hypothetical protein